jgi:rRNA maturation RNase YbeY
MSATLGLRNRQRIRRVNLSSLRLIVGRLLEGHFQLVDYELCIHLIGAAEMSRLNWKFLQHEGSTDVITFAHAGTGPAVSGEIFICLDDAVAHARRFRTTWQSELVRYVIHGLLHLRGHDDSEPAARRLMKREENRLLKAINLEFPMARLAQRNSRPARRPVSSSTS